MLQGSFSLISTAFLESPVHKLYDSFYSEHPKIRIYLSLSNCNMYFLNISIVYTEVSHSYQLLSSQKKNYTHFTANFPLLPVLKNIFQKKTFRTYLRNLTVSFAFHVKFAIW